MLRKFEILNLGLLTFEWKSHRTKNSGPVPTPAEIFFLRGPEPTTRVRCDPCNATRAIKLAGRANLLQAIKTKSYATATAIKNVWTDRLREKDRDRTWDRETERETERETDEGINIFLLKEREKQTNNGGIQWSSITFCYNPCRSRHIYYLRF